MCVCVLIICMCIHFTHMWLSAHKHTCACMWRLEVDVVCHLSLHFLFFRFAVVLFCFVCDQVSHWPQSSLVGKTGWPASSWDLPVSGAINLCHILLLLCFVLAWVESDIPMLTEQGDCQLSHHSDTTTFFSKHGFLVIFMYIYCMGACGK